METRFTAEEFLRLTPEERVQKCRAMAAQAEKLAASGPSKMKTACLDLAKQWATLADEIASELARP